VGVCDKAALARGQEPDEKWAWAPPRLHLFSYILDMISVSAGKKADPRDVSPMNRAEAERHCLLYFEALGSKEEALFFHADQVRISLLTLETIKIPVQH